MVITRWNPDAIVFNSHQVYGTPSYWVLKLFKESSGATILNSVLQTDSTTLITASAISWKSSIDGKSVLRIKVKLKGFSIYFWTLFLVFKCSYILLNLSKLERKK
jgi:alpha-N-arabinofuranosidase